MAETRVNPSRLAYLLARRTPWSESEIQQVECQFPVFDLIFNRQTITPEELEALDLVAIEYAMDAMSDCPTVEDFSDADGHSVYEYLRAKELMREISRLPAARQGVRFF